MLKNHFNHSSTNCGGFISSMLVLQQIERLEGQSNSGFNAINGKSPSESSRGFKQIQIVRQSVSRDGLKHPLDLGPMQVPSVIKHLRNLSPKTEKASLCEVPSIRRTPTKDDGFRVIPIKILGPSSTACRNPFSRIEQKKTLSLEFESDAGFATNENDPKVEIIDLDEDPEDNGHNIRLAEIEVPITILSKEAVQDGRHFLKLLESEIFHLEGQICDLECELSMDDNNNPGMGIPEQVRDAILVVVGKAKLLMTQKMEQFRQLCNQNLQKDTFGRDPRIPTSEDLAGFWDLVSIQVAEVKTALQKLNKLKENNWRESTLPESSQKPSQVVRFRKVRLSQKASGPCQIQEDEKTIARDLARKSLLEEKKRQMKLRPKQDEDVLFVSVPA